MDEPIPEYRRPPGLSSNHRLHRRGRLLRRARRPVEWRKRNSSALKRITAMSFKPALVTAACIALGGCNTANTHIGDSDPFIGEAVKYNAAIQTINPTP